MNIFRSSIQQLAYREQKTEWSSDLSGLSGWVRSFALLVSAGFLILGNLQAHAQALPPPPAMTFHCSPEAVYYQVGTNCAIHVGGGATGSISLSVYSTPVGTFPLDSNGDAQASTGAFQSTGVVIYTVTYLGDANYSPMSRTEDITVYSDRVVVTAETLKCLPYVAYQGQPVSCTVHVPGGATGSVSFLVDGGAWNTVPLNASGDATVTAGLIAAALGPHVVQATYSGDGNFSAFETSVSELVSSQKPQPATMSVGCSPAPITVGQTGTCTAQLTGGATGFVDFYVHDSALASVALDGNGIATAGGAFTSLPAGTYSVVAVYRGNDNFDEASAATSVTVTSGTSQPQVAVSCSPVAIAPGQSTSCSAHLPAGAAGNVVFFVDGQQWASAALDASGFAATPSGLYDRPAGNYAVAAYFAGDGNFSSMSGGVTLTIATNKSNPPIQVACSPSAIQVGNKTNCTATVGGGATGAVLLVSGGQILAGFGLDAAGNVLFQNQVFSGPYYYQNGVPGNAAGSYVVQAVYQGDDNFSPVLASTTVTVTAGAQPSTITAQVAPSAIRNGGQLRVSGHVPGGATGVVDIYSPLGFSSRLQLDSAGNFAGALHATSPQDGTFPITFNYSGDANFAPSTDTETLTISSTAPAEPGQPVPSGAPQITSLSPDHGPLGAQVVINGVNLGTGSTTSATLSGTPLQIVSVTPAAITVLIGNADISGNIVVTVSSQTSNGLIFMIDAPPLCVVGFPN